MSSEMRSITAKYIFDGVNLLTNKIVLLADNQIVDVIDSDKLYDKSQLEDFGNSVISPGMLDLQLNGCGGVLFNADISMETLETMHQTNLKFGTTGFLPTLITADFNDSITALEVVKEWFKQYGNTRGVLGIHLEGPFLSKEKRGIHPEEFIIKPTDEMLAKIVPYAKLFPIKMTMAAENVKPEQIEFLAKHGIIVSIGHSNASYEVAENAFKHGAKTVTHMFNAMSGMTGRNPGLIGAVLANPVYLGLIVDMLHVDKANVRLMTNLKPTSVYLVTDAVTPTGTDMTEFDFAGKHLYVRDGKCVDDAGTLGGAYLTMNEAIENCVEKCGLSLEQSLTMATLIPAQLIGVDDQIGRIAEGYRADLIAIDLDSYSCQLI
ncbi:N-acetylglucosamine-6-phosphate deacetylase [Aquella oligotrophica]|uniref:N-acetylglucosamine-6-phosphate deacetylase n=1 Tax=Aquella oligotrophica TaxID=2067065 RepID=A0A2I7N4C6_9NEIS|nr:N-acetylglucosamine-6-phosphate deacetylase [Aquella oligotrophica]AUR51317.1 N-acetylglucosamine-6-phosphate deacetylase [Aquella oligotrophica]